MTNELIVPKEETFSMYDKPLSNEEFGNWIQQAEAESTISIKEAKNKWEEKKKELQQLIIFGVIHKFQNPLKGKP